MKVTSLLVGALAAVSVASGLICLKVANHNRAGKRHGKPATFRDLYEDNEPVDDVSDHCPCDRFITDYDCIVNGCPHYRKS